METKCVVCGDRASGHLYYGAKSCLSCRAFFRRTIIEKLNYTCLLNGNCTISAMDRSRKKCKGCRFRLCQKGGMKWSWVATKVENEKKKEKEKEKKKIQEKKPKLPLLLSPDEDELVNWYQRHWNWTDGRDISSYLGMQIIKMLVFRNILSCKGRRGLANLLTLRTKDFLENLPQFRSLSEKDRIVMLENRLPLVTMLRTATLFSPDLDWTKQLTCILGDAEVKRLGGELQNVPDLKHLKLHYTQVFSTNETTSADFFTKYISSLGSLPKDNKHMILVGLLLFFSPENLKIKDLELVEKYQMYFAILLQKYLQSKYYKTPSRAVLQFAHSVEIVSRCLNVNRLYPITDEDEVAIRNQSRKFRKTTKLQTFIGTLQHMLHAT